MNPGLAFFYAGLVRRKNTLNTLMMTYVAMGTGALVWMAAGYSLAFAPGSPFLGGLEVGRALRGGHGPEPAYAATVPASRLRRLPGHVRDDHARPDLGRDRRTHELSRVRLFIGLWSLVVYAPVAHWVWGTGGFVARLGRARLRRRNGRARDGGDRGSRRRVFLGPRQDNKRIALIPHNVPYVAARRGPPLVRVVRLQRGIRARGERNRGARVRHDEAGAASALLTWILLENYFGGHATAVGAATGAVVGLVGITPGRASCRRSPRSRSGRYGARELQALRLRGRTSLDDTLDVFACHGIGGITGSILTGVFASKAANPDGGDGLLAGGAALLGIQLGAVAVVFLYTAAATAGVLLLVKP